MRSATEMFLFQSGEGPANGHLRASHHSVTSYYAEHACRVTTQSNTRLVPPESFFAPCAWEVKRLQRSYQPVLDIYGIYSHGPVCKSTH
ncbi:hypothetical protein J6590_002805 [Homalodisca vitripennis]|nr:hypothetical protein J6590_002805 [Homalodisca vitripennis]